MKRHKEDALERVQRCARAYRDAVENLIATAGHVGSISLDKAGTRIYFCIEGVTTLEELRISREQFRASLDFEGEK